jgi:DNA-binding MarR family transcriptional regulator
MPKTMMRSKDYEALAEFRYALRKFFRFSEEAAEKSGLSIRQYQALLTIRGFPGGDNITVGKIAEWLQIRHHSAVGLINRLEIQGFVVRRKGSQDRREVYIRLTSKGNRILKKLAFLNKQELKRLRPQQFLSKLLLKS